MTSKLILTPDLDRLVAILRRRGVKPTRSSRFAKLLKLQRQHKAVIKLILPLGE